ncbi:hypothetical protein [Streptomyces sp. OM5714]|uniref:hypothetical protein n=1 Tax=Streptomyces sp. OM5714 TaxID=2602736 RepID=UPI0013DA6E49|nr:hypothetical protein [Streptomyces sp. OM5714]KAF2774609.1 hypothetical protein STPH1_7780 [Streptomyces sp. OM5714]
MDLSKGGGEPRVFKRHMATATLHEDRVDFKRPLVARLGGNRSSTVLLGDVLKILRREPTRLANGHIHLLTTQDDGPLRAASMPPEKTVAGNPRAIMFTWQQRQGYADFLAASSRRGNGATRRGAPALNATSHAAAFWSCDVRSRDSAVTYEKPSP